MTEHCKALRPKSTIKSLQRKISALEKSEAKITTQFAEFQHQSVSNIAKLEHKKELIEIKEKKKKESENLKRRERMNEKEKHKTKIGRSYHDASRIYAS